MTWEAILSPRCRAHLLPVKASLTLSIQSVTFILVISDEVVAPSAHMVISVRSETGLAFAMLWYARANQTTFIFISILPKVHTPHLIVIEIIRVVI